MNTDFKDFTAAYGRKSHKNLIQNLTLVQFAERL